MDDIVIGTCSACGGPVVTPRVWGSVTPPPMICRSCGATKNNYGPVIDMGKPKDYPQLKWSRNTVYNGNKGE